MYLHHLVDSSSHNPNYHNNYHSNPTPIYNTTHESSLQQHHGTTTTVAPVTTSAHDSTLKGSQLRGSQTRTRGSKYDQYRHRANEYKYNLFSLIDEPWNRCCEIGKCGNCPGNECVARREPRII